MACQEVKTGDVMVPGEDYGLIQESVKTGHNLWRLSPVRTAQVVGSEYLGLRPTDSYTIVEQYYDRGSGLQHAVVRVRHGSCSYLVELFQPQKQSQGGIWIVQSVTEL